MQTGPTPMCVRDIPGTLKKTRVLTGDKHGNQNQSYPSLKFMYPNLYCMT